MKDLLKHYKMVLTYFSHSVLSTVLDTAIVWWLLKYMKLDITWANTCGVAAGFVVGFFLDVKRTFCSNYTPATFSVYFGTFLLGLALANVLITTSYDMVSTFLPQGWAFLFSKGVSVAIPFFAMYIVRKFAYQAIERRRVRDE